METGEAPCAARDERVIRVEGLTRRYGAFTAVDAVSFDVCRGEIFGYLGANGAGKSTTIRMLCGLLQPTSGLALVAGHDIAKHPESVKASLGYMSQKFSLYLDLPVLANVEFFAGAYGLSGERLRARREAVLDMVGLRGQERARTGDLPGGTRQRLALGCALLHEPPLVFLDEPTAGVDPASRRDFWRLIRGLSEAGTTVFVTTHYMDEAEYCDRIGLMVSGKLVALDTPSELKRALVPGALYVVEARGLTAALPALRALPFVADAQPFGTAAHVRIAPETDHAERRLRDALRGAGLVEPSVTRGEPTLEDVFLAVSRDEGGAPS